MRFNYAFSHWDPIRGEFPGLASAVFTNTVQTVRRLVEGRTLEELAAAVDAVKQRATVISEASRADLDLLMGKALAAQESARAEREKAVREREEALAFLDSFPDDGTAEAKRVIGEKLKSIRLGWPGANPGLEPKALEGFAAAYVAHRFCETAKACMASMSSQEPPFPGAKPFEYGAAWALYKAAVAVKAMNDIAGSLGLFDPYGKEALQAEDLDGMYRFLKAKERLGGLLEEFYDAAGFALSLYRKRPTRAKRVLCVDQQVMSDMGRKGGRARNRLSNSIRIWVLQRFRQLWKEGKHKNVRAAARSLIKPAIQKAREIGAPCLWGDEVNSFNTIYSTWICPYFNRYMKNSLRYPAASSSTSDRKTR